MSFATTGEKTVAAVMTCRNEAVSAESDSQHLGVSFFVSPRNPRNQESGHTYLVTKSWGRQLGIMFSFHLQSFLHTPLVPRRAP